MPAGLAAATLAVPLALWYVLRARRPRVEVASTYLWQRTDRSVAAAVPWQRFRPDRTFWLVLAAIVVGAVALARPTVPATASLGDDTILVMDASASMSADEDGPSRLELARREADDLVGQLGPGQRMSVIEAGPRARTLLSGSADPGALRRALAGVRPSHAPADLTDAFTLAAALERPGQATVAYLLTDGAVPDAHAAGLPAGLRVHAVGSDRPNLAVTRLQAVPTGAGGGQAFVQVRNYGLAAVDARVTLGADGSDAVIAEQRLRLPARATEDLVIPVAGTGEGDAVLRATVQPDTATRDALAVDDTAWAVLAGPRAATVLVAGEGNVFVEAALHAVDGVEVRTAPAVPDDLTGIDVVVVDGVPAPPAPARPTVYLAPAAPPEGVVVDGEHDLPALTFQDPAHELLGDVDLSEVAIAAAQTVEAPALRTVAGGPGGPLLLAGRLGATPVVYLAFDLAASNLPLQPAWPVLVANTLTWLTGPPTPAPLLAGSEAAVDVPAGVTGVRVAPPSGAPQDLDPARPRVTVDQVGVWAVTYDGPREVVDALRSAPALAVNLAPEEGDLARERPDPAAATPGGGDAGGQAGEAGVPADASDARRVVGPGLLVVVVALLLVEWAAAHGVHPLGRLRAWLGVRTAGRLRDRSPPRMRTKVHR